MTKKQILVLAGIAVATVLAFMFIAPFFSAEAGARRVYNKFFDSFEINDVATVKELLAPEYTDSAGFSRDEFCDFFRLLRKEIYACDVSRDEVSAVFGDDKKSATIDVSVSVSGKGAPIVNEALIVSRVVPVTVKGRLVRVSWKPWDWKIVGAEFPYAREAKSFKNRLARAEEAAAKRTTGGM